jgi:hypothetical protein
VTLPDVVYPVRAGQTNEELRYSLRSLANLPHREVWIVGHCPTWVRNVQHIRVAQNGSKWENSTANLQAAVDHPDVADRFVLMNDDFFILEPLDQLPVLHRGPMAELGQNWGGRYRTGNDAARELLAQWGHDDPMSYELHVPLPVVKDDLADTLARLASSNRPMAGVAKRSLYGNLHELGGRQVDDVKVANPDAALPDGPFASTTDRSFRGKVAAAIHRRFPDPSQYERDNTPEMWIRDDGRTVRVRPNTQLHRRLERDPNWRPA